MKVSNVLLGIILGFLLAVGLLIVGGGALMNAGLLPLPAAPVMPANAPRMMPGNAMPDNMPRMMPGNPMPNNMPRMTPNNAPRFAPGVRLPFWLVLVLGAVGVVVLVALAGLMWFATRGAPARSHGVALEALQVRYARGEITQEQYNTIKQDIMTGS